MTHDQEAIVVLNAGSSSLKFSIFRVRERELDLVARGQIEGLGTLPKFKANDPSGNVLADITLDGARERFRHGEAFTLVADWLREHFGDAMTLLAIGHRVAHGGLAFSKPTLIDSNVIAQLEALTPLVPLHQPHNIAAIRAVQQLRPDVLQIACFDTAFHHGRAEVTQRFGLPDELFQRGVRRWGFHGLSYESIAAQLKKRAPKIAAGRVIVAHLGSGASLCAMRDGRSVETTMGFSALDGMPMGTRCGSLDPGAILFLLQHKSREEVEELLYRKSGLLGISGVSNDVRQLLASDSPRAAAAVEYFVYRAIREIGSLTAALGGIDALVFTAGIGENSPVIRERICRQLDWLGVVIDPDTNRRGEGLISPPHRSPAVWVIPTDEEAVIASGTLAVVRAAEPHLTHS